MHFVWLFCYSFCLQCRNIRHWNFCFNINRSGTRYIIWYIVTVKSVQSKFIYDANGAIETSIWNISDVGTNLQNDGNRDKLKTGIKMHSLPVVNSITICKLIFKFRCIKWNRYILWSYPSKPSRGCILIFVLFIFLIIDDAL